MVTREEVINALKDCYDPEIPINIWDLGLVYDIAIEGEKVHVKMTLTAPGCPASVFIAEEVKAKLESLPDVKEAAVEIVWDPPWDPSRMSEEAKAMLGLA